MKGSVDVDESVVIVDEPAVVDLVVGDIMQSWHCPVADTTNEVSQILLSSKLCLNIRHPSLYDVCLAVDISESV